MFSRHKAQCDCTVCKPTELTLARKIIIMIIIIYFIRTILEGEKKRKLWNWSGETRGYLPRPKHLLKYMWEKEGAILEGKRLCQRSVRKESELSTQEEFGDERESSYDRLMKSMKSRWHIERVWKGGKEWKLDEISGAQHIDYSCDGYLLALLLVNKHDRKCKKIGP